MSVGGNYEYNKINEILLWPPGPRVIECKTSF